MNRNTLKSLLVERMRELGIPEHMMAVRLVPSRVEADVIVGGQKVTLSCMSGLPENEIKSKIAAFEHALLNAKGTVDIEEMITKKVRA